MNRSRYVTRQLDSIDRAIIAALTEDGRMTFKELAKQIGLSSPSIYASTDTAIILSPTVVQRLPKIQLSAS
jgi:hypothetical protein